ncbi:HAD-IB family hydrolase [Shewanella sp. 10N.286.52.B9]|uniref:HAD-IB family hydrolase n=1 Tax=Shewanella sp. 10N.286.52.B9 TaxID=1880837 RepID=UPI000C867AA3|nr:HAD-IB family hydrolase [Shewanella sp. 10N.286.52.B9]PMG41314.1 hypothetical protein BCU91_10940 [Shewanella sp. 10N.286.52.B9]
MNLALFDFDGTITSKDTYTPFIYSSVPKWRLIVCYPILIPVIAAYKWQLIGGSRTRSIISKFAFWQQDEQHIKAIGEDYATSFDLQIKPQALARLQWHQMQGDTIVVLSASLNVYLAPWCRQHGFKLICAELESKKGKLTGRYINGDCSGAAKSNRVLAQFDLQDFDKVYAYGDTEEDKPMLELADVSYYRWQKLTG